MKNSQHTNDNNFDVNHRRCFSSEETERPTKSQNQFSGARPQLGPNINFQKKY